MGSPYFGKLPSLLSCRVQEVAKCEAGFTKQGASGIRSFWNSSLKGACCGTPFLFRGILKSLWVGS